MADRIIRKIRIEGDVAYVPLTREREAIIDAADAVLVSGSNWVAVPACRTFYATRASFNAGTRKTLYLHRAIMSPPLGVHVDHIDGDGLNNRRSNLREATASQNSRNSRLRSTNTSGFKGVCWCKRSLRWFAYITLERRQKHLGYFETAEEAHASYSEAATRLHGEFARVA